MRAAKSFTSKGASFGSAAATWIGAKSSTLSRRFAAASGLSGARSGCAGGLPGLALPSGLGWGAIVGVAGFSPRLADRMGDSER